MYFRQQEFTSSGSWVCPAGVTSIIVLGQGAGGGGGSAGDYTGSGFYFGGQGGVATFLVPRVVDVTPGTTYTITIGAGGAGATSYAVASPGGDTSFGSDHVWKGALGGYNTGDGAGLVFIHAKGYATWDYDVSGSGFSINGPVTIPGTSYFDSNPGTSFANIGPYSFTSSAFGTANAGGGGAPGMSSDAGRGGAGGNGATSSVNAQNGANAASTSYGAGGGGAGCFSAARSTQATGGTGAGGRLIVIWAE